MKVFWSVLPGLVFAVLIALPIGASADTLSQSGVVTIRATVLPARYILVDEQGVITSIISNTKEDVTPTAYAGSIAAEKAVPMTPQLLEKYQQLLQTLNTDSPGVIYKRPAATPRKPAPAQQPKVLQLISKKHA